MVGAEFPDGGRVILRRLIRNKTQLLCQVLRKMSCTMPCRSTSSHVPTTIYVDIGTRRGPRAISIIVGNVLDRGTHIPWELCVQCHKLKFCPEFSASRLVRYSESTINSILKLKRPDSSCSVTRIEEANRRSVGIYGRMFGVGISAVTS